PGTTYERIGYIAGILCCAANSKILSRLRRSKKSGKTPTTSAPAPRSTMLVKAALKSCSLRHSRTMSCRPSARAAACMLFVCSSNVRNREPPARKAIDQLAHELDAFTRNLDGAEVDASKVAARPVEAGDEAMLHRINAGHEDDRNGRGGGLCCKYRAEGACYDDDGRLTMDQIFRQRRQPVVATLRP